MGFVGPRHDLQRRCQVAQLCLAQQAGEMLTDAPEVRLRCLPDDGTAVLGEMGEDDAGVLVASSPFHQPVPLQLVDQARQAARREHHPVGQVRHPQRVAGCPSQAEEDVVVTERDAVLGPELCVERPRQVVVGMEKRLPRAELGVADSGLHPE